MEHYPPVWVLRHLFKESSLFPGKFRVLDTLLGTSEATNPFLWLYTTSKGEVKVKPKASTESILEVFLEESPHRNEGLFGHYIYSEEYSPLSRKLLHNKILNQGLNDTEAIQYYPPTATSSNSVYLIEKKATHEKFYKTSLDEGNKKKIKLNSSTHCLQMAAIAKEVVKTLEKNGANKGQAGRFMVEEISLVFVEDFNRQLWLMGSVECKAGYVNGSTTKLSIQNSLKKLELGKEISVKSSSAYGNLNLTNKTNFNRLGSHKKNCDGDFCNLILISHDLRNKTEIDYDNFLQKVSLAYKERHDKLLKDIKLAIRADYLLSDRLKLQRKSPIFIVPYNFILLGRKILELSNFDHLNNGPMEVLVHKMIESIKAVREIFENNDMQSLAMKSPFHYYSNAKVCSRCYQVYSLFTLPMKSQSRPNDDSSDKHEVKSIDNNDLDDLLEDIVDLKFDMKHGQPRNLYRDLGSCSWRVQDSKESVSPQSAMNAHRRATIEVKRTENVDYEKLTRLIFPDINKGWDSKKSNKQTYDGFIKNLQKRQL